MEAVQELSKIIPSIESAVFNKAGGGGDDAYLYVLDLMTVVLTAYGESGNLARAVRKAKISWQTHEAWLRAHRGYREAIKLVDRMLARDLFGAEYQRALEGVSRDVQYVLGRLDRDTYADSIKIDVRSEPTERLKAMLATLRGERALIVDAEIAGGETVEVKPAQDAPQSSPVRVAVSPVADAVSAPGVDPGCAADDQRGR